MGEIVTAVARDWETEDQCGGIMVEPWVLEGIYQWKLLERLVFVLEREIQGPPSGQQENVDRRDKRYGAYLVVFQAALSLAFSDADTGFNPSTVNISALVSMLHFPMKDGGKTREKSGMRRASGRFLLPPPFPRPLPL